MASSHKSSIYDINIYTHVYTYLYVTPYYKTVFWKTDQIVIMSHTYMTGFVKTDRIVTITEIRFIA